MIRNNPTLKPSKLKRRRRKIFAVKAGFVFLLLIGFVFLLSWFSKTPSLQIGNIEVLGNSTVSADEIIGLIKRETAAKYFLLFSKNSIFLYPKKTIKEKILTDFKKVEKVEINSRGLKTIEARLVERKPDFIWCSGGGEDKAISGGDSGNCYFMDREGMIFSSAPDFSGNTYIRYYGLIGDTNPIGKIYAPSAKLKEIADFVDSLKDSGIFAAEFHAETANDYKIYLENGIKIIFDDRQPLDKTLGNINSILVEIDLKNYHSANNPPKYDTADLRFGNKVFLKKEQP